MKQDKYMGLDVHQATTVAVVLDAEGKVILETMVVTQAASMVRLIESLNGPMHVTLEETTQAEWLYEVIRPHVQEVVVCDPRRNKLLSEGSKADKVDARKLADLLRTGMLRTVYHGYETRKLKELVRGYENLSSDMQRGDGTNQGHLSRPRDCDNRSRGLSTPAKRAVAGKVDRVGTTATRRVAPRATGSSPATAEEGPAGDGEREPKPPGREFVANDSAAGAHSSGNDCSDRRHPLPIPYEASVLELRRAGGGHAHECRVRNERGESSPAEKTCGDAGSESQLQSTPEGSVYLRGYGRLPARALQNISGETETQRHAGRDGQADSRT